MQTHIFCHINMIPCNFRKGNTKMFKDMLDSIGFISGYDSELASAMDAELADEIKQQLTGCRFTSHDLHNALMASPKAQIQDVARYILEQNL